MKSSFAVNESDLICERELKTSLFKMFSKPLGIREVPPKHPQMRSAQSRKVQDMFHNNITVEVQDLFHNNLTVEVQDMFHNNIMSQQNIQED